MSIVFTSYGIFHRHLQVLITGYNVLEESHHRHQEGPGRHRSVQSGRPGDDTHYQTTQHQADPDRMVSIIFPELIKYCDQAYD